MATPQAETSGMDREIDLEGGTEMDLDSYQVTLEEVLTWLLSAEDTLQIQDEVSDDVEEVKDQFHTHEVLQLHLDYKYCNVQMRFAKYGDD